MKKYLPIISLFFLLIACDAAKRVPEGSYLLNKVKIETDTKEVKSNQLKSFLRQKPNSSFPIIGRVPLHLYNLAGSDSSWIDKTLLKIGERPVIYSERLTAVSAEQMLRELNNRGYLNAQVDTSVVKKEKKADVSYHVIGNEPYRIRNVKDTLQSVDTTIYKILKEEKKLDLIKENDLFDQKALEQIRVDLSKTLTNRGYFDFSKDYFYFLADTTVGNHKVDLTLALNNPSDTSRHRRYFIGDVMVYNGFAPPAQGDSSLRSDFDTVRFKNIRVISNQNILLKPPAIYYNTFLRPGRLYSERILERTYSSLNNLGSVSRTNISFTPIQRNDSNFLNTTISLLPGNLHYLQFGIDGTNSAGDLGAAANLTYEHRNLLKGGERFRVRLNGAYEFITASDSANLLDQSFYEYGAEVFLSIPQLLVPWLLQQLQDRPSASTEFSLGVNFQKRPEYHRQFFNLSSRLQWSSFDWRLTHVLTPLNVNYVRMPWTSDLFRNTYLNDNTNPVIRQSYEDQLIASTSYYVTLSNTNARFLPRMPFQIRSGFEISGYLPRLVSVLGGSNTNANGYREILGIPYAEYLKSDLDVSLSYPIDETKAIAGHFAAGVALPYGNSDVLPFEKRYFGGGANSLRGWNTRSLGPGSYSRDSVGYDFVNKTGDIKLEMSLEYRQKLTNLFQLAAFVDAGNVWTIKDYIAQSGGYFRWNTFYKEIALSYGLGFRLDLNFLLLRLDAGMKAHNPALPEGDRWTIFKPKFSRDFAIHFAIGYPF